MTLEIGERVLETHVDRQRFTLALCLRSVVPSCRRENRELGLGGVIHARTHWRAVPCRGTLRNATITTTRNTETKSELEAQPDPVMKPTNKHPRTRKAKRLCKDTT